MVRVVSVLRRKLRASLRCAPGSEPADRSDPARSTRCICVGVGVGVGVRVRVRVRVHQVLHCTVQPSVSTVQPE